MAWQTNDVTEQSPLAGARLQRGRSTSSVRAPQTPLVHAAKQAGALYTAEQRVRRDASPWTLVQGILAPVQFVVFLASLALVIRFLITGEGYMLATGSIVLKTFVLYAIMITGSIWEKDVFGKYLFAGPFFWEDVVSMGVLALHTAYLVAVFANIGSPAAQMWLALAAYAAYVVNAAQFVWKLRMARLEGQRTKHPQARESRQREVFEQEVSAQRGLPQPAQAARPSHSAKHSSGHPHHGQPTPSGFTANANFAEAGQ